MYQPRPERGHMKENTMARFLKSMAIATVIALSLVLVACGGSAGPDPIVTCPTGQTLVGGTCQQQQSTTPTIGVSNTSELANGDTVTSESPLSLIFSAKNTVKTEIYVDGNKMDTLGATATSWVFDPAKCATTNKAYSIALKAYNSAGEVATTSITVTVAIMTVSRVCNGVSAYTDLNGWKVKDIPTSLGPKVGTIGFIVNGGKCGMTVTFDDDLTPAGGADADKIVYAPPPKAGGSLKVGALYTCTLYYKP